MTDSSANRQPGVHELDVCIDLARGIEPFAKIMKAIGQLPDGERLRLISPFQPLPLITILRARGFSIESREIAPDRWETLLCRRT